MMEKLFAVGRQRETFLFLCLCGAALGFLYDLTRLTRHMGRAACAAGDALVSLALFAMLAFAFYRAGEGLRLYGLLGAALGAALYLTLVSPLIRRAAAAVKKLTALPRHGRKNA